MGYAHTTLVNTLLAEDRRPWRRSEVVTPAESLRDTGVDPTTPVTDRLALDRCLAQLPTRQRIAVVLRHLEGLSVRDTAAAMGCSEGTVKSQTSDGLRAMRVQLESEEDADVPG